MRQGFPFWQLLFNIVLKVLVTSTVEEKQIKRIQIGKEEAIHSLFADDMILYIENPKEATRKFLELIKEYSKVTGLLNPYILKNKDRNINQWNKMESPEINTHTYRQFIFDKGDKIIQQRKTVTSISGAGKIDQLHVKE